MLRTLIKKFLTILVIFTLFTSGTYPYVLITGLVALFQQEKRSGIVDKIYLAKNNKNVVDNFSGGTERASAAVNAAEREYVVDLGPINASTTANYVYASFFNPSGSGRTLVVKRLAIRANTASSTASNYVNLTTRRITAASVGTQLTQANIPKKNTGSVDSIAEVRFNGPTVTLSGTVDSRILGQPLSGAVGSFYSRRDITFKDLDEKIVLKEGEGIAVYQEAAGALATKVRVTIEWDEQTNAPTAQNEFLFAFPRVEVAATANYVYNSFFNPVASGKTAVIKRIWYGTETCDAAAVYTNRISIKRTSAASAGTAITATNIPKKNTGSANSVMDFRRTGVTVTTVGGADARIASVTPCGTTGQPNGWHEINFDQNDEKLVLQQGEGIALLSETSGDLDQLVRMIIEWQEVDVASTPSSGGEYIWASSGVQAAVAATTTQYAFFNPAGSGKSIAIKRFTVRVNATTTGAYASYTLKRLSASSGGTLVAATDLPKKHTGSANSIMEVRWCGLSCASAITTTYVGGVYSRLFSVTSPATVAQVSGQRDIIFGDNEDIILQPGEGVGFYNELLTSSAGDVVRVSLEWQEVASTPASQGQYLVDIGPISGSTATSYNYATLFNPVASGKSAVIKRVSVRVDAVAAAVYIPMQLRRISTASAGTQIAVADIPKKHTGTANSVLVIRHTGVTATYSGTTDSKIVAVQTPGAVQSSISGPTGYKEIVFTPAESLILKEGEGIGLYHDTSAGDVDFRVRLLVEWEEVATGSTPSPLNEYFTTTGPITQSTAANYVYTTLFNPANSAKNYIVKRIAAQVNRSGTAVAPTYTSVAVRRISASSGGTLVASSSLPKKNTGTATSSAEVRTTGVVATLLGALESRLLSVMTPGVVNQMFGNFETEITVGDELIVKPGEGVALYQEQANGDALVRYRFLFEWEEESNAAPAQSITFAVSTTTLYFGQVSSVLARYASSTNPSGSDVDVVAHTLSVSTNAVNGYNISVQGATLNTGVDTIDAIGGTATTSNIGTEQFGLRITAAGGSGSVASPYNTSNFAYNATASSSVQVASASVGDEVETVYSVRYLSNIAGITNSGTYTANLVYIATANF